MEFMIVYMTTQHYLELQELFVLCGYNIYCFIINLIIIFSPHQNCLNCQTDSKCGECEPGYMLDTTHSLCCIEYGCKSCTYFDLRSDDGKSCDECFDGLL